MEELTRWMPKIDKEMVEPEYDRGVRPLANLQEAALAARASVPAFLDDLESRFLELSGRFIEKAFISREDSMTICIEAIPWNQGDACYYASTRNDKVVFCLAGSMKMADKMPLNSCLGGKVELEYVAARLAASLAVAASKAGFEATLAKEAMPRTASVGGDAAFEVKVTWKDPDFEAALGIIKYPEQLEAFASGKLPLGDIICGASASDVGDGDSAIGACHGR